MQKTTGASQDATALTVNPSQSYIPSGSTYREGPTGLFRAHPPSSTNSKAPLTTDTPPAPHPEHTVRMVVALGLQAWGTLHKSPDHGRQTCGHRRREAGSARAPTATRRARPLFTPYFALGGCGSSNTFDGDKGFLSREELRLKYDSQESGCGGAGGRRQRRHTLHCLRAHGGCLLLLPELEQGPGARPHVASATAGAPTAQGASTPSRLCGHHGHLHASQMTRAARKLRRHPDRRPALPISSGVLQRNSGGPLGEMWLS